jgi:hypothetical protein
MHLLVEALQNAFGGLVSLDLVQESVALFGWVLEHVADVS